VPRRVAIIGAALDLGAGRRGVDMGPSAIRYAGLSDRLERAGIEVEDRGNVAAALAETRVSGSERARFLDEILETCVRIADEVEASRSAGLVPLVLGGDHSIGIGTLSGLAASGRGGVLWLDAHGDLNTPETTPSGNVHGMPLAVVLGVCGGAFSRAGLRLPAVDPARVALVGIRSLDPGEQTLVRELDLAVYTISDLDRRGVEPVIAEALERIAGGSFVHVSVEGSHTGRPI
jgi:arginase